MFGIFSLVHFLPAALILFWWRRRFAAPLSSASPTSSVGLCLIPVFHLWTGTATFPCSETVFVFVIPVCLDPRDPVDCGNSVPPCHSEPVWRNDLVSRTRSGCRNLPRCVRLFVITSVRSLLCHSLWSFSLLKQQTCPEATVEYKQWDVLPWRGSSLCTNYLFVFTTSVLNTCQM